VTRAPFGAGPPSGLAVRDARRRDPDCRCGPAAFRFRRARGACHRGRAGCRRVRGECPAGRTRRRRHRRRLEVTGDLEAVKVAWADPSSHRPGRRRRVRRPCSHPCCRRCSHRSCRPCFRRRRRDLRAHPSRRSCRGTRCSLPPRPCPVCSDRKRRRPPACWQQALRRCDRPPGRMPLARHRPSRLGRHRDSAGRKRRPVLPPPESEWDRRRSPLPPRKRRPPRLQ
jgi:hypothetical protein